MPKRTDAQPQQQIVIQPPAAPPVEPEEKQPREEKEPRWFFDLVKDVPKGEWSTIYHLEVSRLEPKVAGVPGSKGYLAIFFEPIGPEDIRKRWGGGKFRLDLCKNGKFFRTHHMDIEGDPIYDRSREMSPAAAAPGAGETGTNSELLKALDKQTDRIFSILSELKTGDKNNPALTSSIEMLSTAYKEALSSISGSTAPQDSVQQLTQTLALVDKLLSVRGGGGGSSLSDTINLLTSLGVLTKPKTLKEQLEEARLLSDLVGGAGGGGALKDWKGTLAKAAVDHLPELISVVRERSENDLATARARKAEADVRARTAETLRTVPTVTAAPGPAPAAAAAPAPPLYTAPAIDIEPIAAAAAPAPAPPAPAEPSPQSEISAAPPEFSSQEQFDAALKIQVVNMIRLGSGGAAVASMLEDVKPEMAADLLKFPPEAITSFFATDPVLKFAIEDPRWESILQEARDYLSEPEPLTN